MSDTTSNSLSDIYAQAALNYLNANPNDKIALSGSVYERVSAANNGSAPSNAVDNSPSYMCQWFGANCTDDSKSVTADCPSYLKYFNLCKLNGNYDSTKTDSAQAANSSNASGCSICDQVSTWFGEKSSTIVAIVVGFVLLFGAFMIWKN